jgi:plasmid stability protein
MPVLQVRNCPENIYTQLTAAAKKQKRSIDQQVILVLQRGLGSAMPPVKSNQARRRKLLEQVMARQVPEQLKTIDDVRLIREDRDR